MTEIKISFTIETEEDLDNMRLAGYKELKEEHGDIIDEIIKYDVEDQSINIIQQVVQRLYDNPELINQAEEILDV